MAQPVPRHRARSCYEMQRIAHVLRVLGVRVLGVLGVGVVGLHACVRGVQMTERLKRLEASLGHAQELRDDAEGRLMATESVKDFLVRLASDRRGARVWRSRRACVEARLHRETEARGSVRRVDAAASPRIASSVALHASWLCLVAPFGPFWPLLAARWRS